MPDDPREGAQINPAGNGGESEAAELDPDADRERRQREISRQLTRLVDVLYALVLVQGAINYRALFTIGDEFLHPARALPVVLALALIYFTAIQSFVDYHLASEDQPYQLLDPDAGNRRVDLWRFYLDIVIVGLYSFLLLKCHVLIAAPGADLTPAFCALPAVFGLYLLWGALRGSTNPNPDKNPGQRYRPILLAVCGVLYAVLAAAYIGLADGWLANAIFLGLALLIMVAYRWVNWSQNETPASKAAAKPPAASKRGAKPGSAPPAAT